MGADDEPDEPEWSDEDDDEPDDELCSPPVWCSPALEEPEENPPPRGTAWSWAAGTSAGPMPRHSVSARAVHPRLIATSIPDRPWPDCSDSLSVLGRAVPAAGGCASRVPA